MKSEYSLISAVQLKLFGSQLDVTHHFSFIFHFLCQWANYHIGIMKQTRAHIVFNYEHPKRKSITHFLHAICIMSYSATSFLFPKLALDTSFP